jgi:hypothetical protein
MKKKKVLKPKIGDEVKLIKMEEAKDFFPRFISENPDFDLSILNGKVGIVRDIQGENEDTVGIDLREEIKDKTNLTHNLDNIIINNTGIYVDSTNYEIIEEPSTGDAKTDAILQFFKENYFKQLEEAPKLLKSYTENIKYCSDRIENYLLEIENQKKTILNYESQIVGLKSIQEDAFDRDDIIKFVEKLKKHKDIKSINCEDKYLIATTNDLIYHHRDKSVQDFNVGAFKIFIPKDNNGSIYAINYKRQIQKFSLHHPCIHDGGICMGSNVQNEVYKLLKERNYAQIIYLLIDFLKEPNYGHPHCDAIYFMLAQPVTIKPKKELGWLDRSEWSKEKFDIDHYNRMKIAIENGVKLTDLEKGGRCLDEENEKRLREILGERTEEDECENEDE